MEKIKAFFANRWVGFGLSSLLLVLWFGAWSGYWWMLLGVAVLYDIYILGYLKRYVGDRNSELCRRSALYRGIYEWVNSLIFATVVATLIHTYLFQLYVIPTSSMEKSLLVGDYLYVSKVSYGPKMPNTPISFPFVHHTMPMSTTAKSFCDAVQWPYHRLAGLKPIMRGDVVVFNFPAGDTVLLENQGVTYYDVLRGYQSNFGEVEGRKRLFRDYTVISRPVDKRENYIKRLVAMPGDTLELRASRLYINGAEESVPEQKQYIYIVRVSSPFSPQALQQLNITEAMGNGVIYQMPLTQHTLREVEQLPNVISVQQYIAEGVDVDVFPNDNRFGWNHDNMGPIWVPSKGATVDLTVDNLPLYRRIISLYEGHDLRVDGEQIYIDGERVSNYTFAMDYYWMMGDNRHNSADSRFWGFVPEDHVVGKASFVWLSLDSEGSFPANIRWDRLFKKIR
ncbi:MAG: signal peptidase I [Rikenellaceae bacterium]